MTYIASVLLVLLPICATAYNVPQFSQFQQQIACDANVTATFISEKLVPDLINIPPYECISITYPDNVTVNLGNMVTPTQAKINPPTVYWRADPNAYYTITMTDPDDVLYKQARLWYVVNIPGNNVAAGETLFEYIGIGPSKADGVDRVVFLVFQQPTGLIKFNETFTSNTNATNRANTNLNDFAAEYNLITVAGNFFRSSYDSYTPIILAELGLPH